jgi:hypothetical protein
MIMADNNLTSENSLKGQAHAHKTCPVCGAGLYCTDHGNHEATFHCSSEQARFWDFERGTPAQATSKDHWDKSRVEEFLGKDDPCYGA